MRLLQVRASSSGLRRKTVSFEPPREAQQGRTIRPLHREGQIVFSLMLFSVLVVYSLLVLAGGKRTGFLIGREGKSHRCKTGL